MRSIKFVVLSGVCATALFGSHSSIAAPLGIYGAPIDLNSPLVQAACMNVGDVVSCSAPLLNYFSGMAPSTKTTAGGYVLATPQGALDSYIVLGAGGQAALGNGDTTPIKGAVEDGFKTNAGSDSYFATGKTSTSTEPGAQDPKNNSLMAGADLPGTWDVGLDWLRQALTINGVRRDLMIGFDYNQPQNATTSLDYWALITLRDLQDPTKNIYYEVKNTNNTPWNTFINGRTSIDVKPNSTDFSTVNGVTCIDNSTSPPTIVPKPGGNCPSGWVTIDNAQSTSDTEIFAFLPKLNAGLESFIKDGYDVASVRMEFGCFQKVDPTGPFNPGTGYLADEDTGGKTTNCESGGFGDVYLLAAGTWGENVPEPGSLALLGMGLLGLTIARRRTSSRKH